MVFAVCYIREAPKKRSSGLRCVDVAREIPLKAAGRKQSIYFWMPVA